MTKRAASGEPRFHPGCVMALQQGSTLEVGEKRCQRKKIKKIKIRNTAGVFRAADFTWCTQWIIRPLLKSNVVRNTQRGPSALTEPTGVRSMFADIKDSTKDVSDMHSVFVSCRVSNKHVSSSNLLSNCGSRNGISQFFSLNVLHFWDYK